MRPDDAPEIRALDLFRTMSQSSFETMVRAAYLQSFPAQVQLITEGGCPDFLHVVIEGTVELYAGWNDRETAIAILAPVSTFILAASITDRPYLMSARTVSQSRIALVPSEDIRRIFAEDGDFALAIAAELARCFRDAVRHTKDLKLRSSVERLANYLVRQRAASGSDEIDLPYEKRLLASWLGMTPENLSRAFAALRSYGVTVAGARVRIAKPGDLIGLAKPVVSIDDPRY